MFHHIHLHILEIPNLVSFQLILRLLIYLTTSEITLEEEEEEPLYQETDSSQVTNLNCHNLNLGPEYIHRLIPGLDHKLIHK